ncbi:hypothetical protein [Bacillus thuringiensis]|uniref:hypothetical protein n=1 Tax=Bacillus thuringiensis TaxID=1428 RepID=UPI0021D67D99|nr:hypothetical protein [Bacillus thuringiensis]MCU7667553.1 hypothetical protein [Bacillus thuringiensis]
MRKILSLFLILIIIVSGCGINKDEVAKSMKEKIEKGDYEGAKQVYEDANKDLKEDKKLEVDKAVSEMIKEQLDNEFKQVKKENKNTDKFSNLIDFVGTIDLNDTEIKNRITSYNNEIGYMQTYMILKENTKIDEYPKILETISKIPTNSVTYKDNEQSIKSLKDNSNIGIKQILEPLIKQKNIKEFFNQADKLHAGYTANSPAQKEYVQNVHQTLKDNDALFRETLNEIINSNNDSLTILKQVEQWKPELAKEYQGKANELAKQKAQVNIDSYFNIVKDDFEGTTYYIPKEYEADSKKVDLSKSNQVFYPVVMESENMWNKNETSRIVSFAVGIKQEDWLFLDTVSMNVDGEIIGTTSKVQVKRDVSYPYVYESCFTFSNAMLTSKVIDKIVNGKNVVVRYNGKNKNTPDKVLTQEEKNLIKYAWDFAHTK